MAACMRSAALEEAAGWAETLMDAEWQGRRDRENTVRFRLSKKTGVQESYLYRLQYKLSEMNDVRGSVYRALMLAHGAYIRACEQTEEAADAMRVERLKLKAESRCDGYGARSGWHWKQ